MKIVMLGHKRVPSREGGIEVVVEELATRMVKKGHDVTLLNRSSKNKHKDVQNKDYKGVKIKTVPTINRRGLAAMTSSFFAAVVAAFGKYDVVHFHAEGPCAMMWLPKLFGKRCIATIHGLDHRRTKWGKFGGAYIMMGERAAVKRADEIIVLSRSVKDYFMDTYGRKTHFIPNAVTKPEIRDDLLIKEKYNVEKDGYILYLGRLVPEKGLQYLVNAFKSTNTDKKLLIAGAASDTNDFVRKVKKTARGDDRVVFLGFVDGKLLETLYSNAYVYVLPSTLEGMPLSLLEAMSYGNCCLVSDIDECTEVVEDRALTFQKRNTTDLREKLQYLCDNKDVVDSYKTMSSDFILNKYKWDDIVDKTLELYQKP